MGTIESDRKGILNYFIMYCFVFVLISGVSLAGSSI